MATELRFQSEKVGDVHEQILKAQAMLGGRPLVLGGMNYVSMRMPIRLSSDNYSPQDSLYMKLIDDSLQLAGDWEVGHFRRVAYAVKCVLGALRLEEEDLDLGITMAYLYAWPHGLSNSKVSRDQYTRRGQEGTKERFKKSLEANADTIREFLSQESLADAADVMARLVDIKRRPRADVLTTIGSAILLADMIDRECFSENLFNARSAYYMLRWIERGEADLLDGGVIALITHFLSEAMEAAPPRIPGPELKKPEGAAKTVKVRFSHLQPGMRLAAPLKTIQGKKILDSGVVIDSDIIWRLWRISAVTPILTPEIEVNSIAAFR